MGAVVGVLLAGGGAAGSAPPKSQLTPLASASGRERAQKELAGLLRPVRLIVVTRSAADAGLDEYAVRLANDVAALSAQVRVETFDLDAATQQAAALGVAKAPAIVVAGEKDYGVRFYGVPGGGELESLLAAIRRVSEGNSGLSEASRKALAALKRPAHIEVLVSLDCRYCPAAVQMAQRLAVESGLVTADMVEISAFAPLADAYGVKVVPKVMVNGRPCFDGSKAEEEFVAAVVRAASQE